MSSEEISNYISMHLVCYDRFTFDELMRFFLKNDYSHEEAKDLILYNCSLSAIIFQERIWNSSYKLISNNEDVPKDLGKLKQQILQEYFEKLN